MTGGRKFWKGWVTACHASSCRGRSSSQTKRRQSISNSNKHRKNQCMMRWFKPSIHFKHAHHREHLPKWGIDTNKNLIQHGRTCLKHHGYINSVTPLPCHKHRPHNDLQDFWVAEEVPIPSHPRQRSQSSQRSEVHLWFPLLPRAWGSSIGGNGPRTQPAEMMRWNDL